jgi:hypothetical protein
VPPDSPAVPLDVPMPAPGTLAADATVARYVLGVDLGQKQDPTAVAVLRKWGSPTLRKWHHLDLISLAREPLGTTYPNVVRDIVDLMALSTFAGTPTGLVVDATGCGQAPIDLLREAKLKPVAVWITAGDIVTEGQVPGDWRVPKRNLVSQLLVARQTDALKWKKDLPLRDVFERELEAFKVKISLLTAHDSYGAWREGAHDDLVLAVALATWEATRVRPSTGVGIGRLYFETDPDGVRTTYYEGKKVTPDELRRLQSSNRYDGTRPPPLDWPS